MDNCPLKSIGEYFQSSQADFAKRRSSGKPSGCFGNEWAARA
jgi:hypothetical protein